MAIISIKNKTKSGSLLVGNAFYNPPTPTVEYLVIAGGGAGSGSSTGGGGGAGGYRTASSYSVTGGTSYTVTVGAGGSSSVGSDSVFDTITSIGGGFSSGTGGSGFGGNGISGTGFTGGGSGTAGQGNNGGTGYRNEKTWNCTRGNWNPMPCR
jgi:hypothetical protein